MSNNMPGVESQLIGSREYWIEKREAELTAFRARVASLEKELAAVAEIGGKQFAELADIVPRLAAAERDAAAAHEFIREIRCESAEDYRLDSYVVVQMTTETWDKLKAMSPRSGGSEGRS